jgi:hypothetical protein
VTGKLIDEPPLLVLPSLVREVGMSEAILLQQLHYAGQRSVDRWVQRSAADWHRALRGCLSVRTIERVWSALRDVGWIESKPDPGKPSKVRVASAKLAEVWSATPAEVPPPNVRGPVSREEQQREKDLPKEVSEPIGFASWLTFHHELTGSAVPRAGSKRREKLAGIFAGLVQTGAALEDFELESEGVFASPHMREGGHLEPENVLRATRFGKYADVGRRARAARETGVAAKYGHLNVA